jgi:predicted phage terminase large subunit-like protein
VALLDRPQVQMAIRRELGRRELAEFCALMDPFYERAVHSDLLCAELEAVDRGDNDRLIVMEPPRHSKTYHTSERFPAWTMGRDPRQQVILASYAAELAWQNSRKARDLFSHPLWPFRARLRNDSQAMNRWETTEGGILLAAGVGGAMTGFGAHKLIIDDFVKNREDADSEVIREKQWQWFTSTARTRLMPNGAIIVTATHWHEDDLIGRILNSPGAARWRVFRLPAIAEDANDPLGRKPGAALWPAWYDVPALDEIRVDIGSRDWSALYQQRPTADEGGMFKRAWFARRWADDTLPKMVHTVLVLDAAFKTGVQNDPSSLHLWGTDGIDFYVLAERRGRWEYPDLRRETISMADWYKPQTVLIEDTAAGQSAIQELRRDTMLPIVAHKVTASKEARAGAVSPLCEAGKVLLPEHAPWVDEWIDEHAAFPNGRHDDRVDNTSAALERLSRYGRPFMQGMAPLSMDVQTGAATKHADIQRRLAQLTGQRSASMAYPGRRG